MFDRGGMAFSEGVGTARNQADSSLGIEWPLDSQHPIALIAVVQNEDAIAIAGLLDADHDMPGRPRQLSRALSDNDPRSLP